MPIEGDPSALPAVLSHKISVANIENPVEGRITFDEIARSRVATFLGVPSLADFSIAYRIVPIPRERLRLTGQVDARLTQLCVVSREPVEERIEEPLDLECWPEQQLGEVSAPTVEENADGLPEDPALPIVNSQIDVGALAAEIVASAMNPYPRKDGAAFDWQDPKSEGGAAGPFSELGKLKPKG